MTFDYDVAVVGAGPAGLMVAIHASKQNAKVVVIDRKEVVGAPVQCGEGTFGSVLKKFDLADGPWVVNTPTRLRVTSHKGKVAILKAPAVDLRVLDRTMMEQELARRAEESGAKILLKKTVVGVDSEDTGVTLHLDDGKHIRVKAVVGADGIESGIGRAVGLTKMLPLRDLGTAAQYRVRSKDLEDDTAELIFDSSRAPGGYIYVFPKGNGEFNLGAGYLGASGGTAPIDILDKLIQEKYPDMEILQRMGGCVPVGPPLDSAVKGNVLLVGDAARQAYAQAGGGIHTALAAGAMAGDHVGKFVESMDREHLAKYDENWKREMYEVLNKSYARKNWIYKKDRNAEIFVFLARMILPLFDLKPSLLMKIWLGGKRTYE